MFYETQHIGSSDYFKKECGKDYSFPPHLHLCYELIVLLDGEMTVTINGMPYLLRKNEAVLIFPNQLHSLSSTSSKHMLFIFSPRLIQAFSTQKAKLLPNNNQLRLNEYLISSLNELDENSSKFAIKGCLYSVCADFEKWASYFSANNDNLTLLLKIFDYVEQCYSEECTLKTLSHKLGYDYSYLSKYFKRLTSVSFNNYVNIYRLSHAGYVLCNSNCSVLDCAMECGYTSLRTFNRNFREYFNVTPQEYRKRETKKLL